MHLSLHINFSMQNKFVELLTVPLANIIWHLINGRCWHVCTYLLWGLLNFIAQSGLVDSGEAYMYSLRCVNVFLCSGGGVSIYRNFHAEQSY